MPVILWGQYPRSEELIQATRDWDRGRIDISTLKEHYRRERVALKELQNGFSYISTGQLHWEDLIRPLSRFFQSPPGSLKRFYETNTFWRILETSGPTQHKDWMDEYYYLDPFNKNDSLIYTFPFIYLLKDFTKGDLPLELIKNLVEGIQKGMIIFFEPVIGWKTLSQEEKSAAERFLSSIKKVANVPIALMTSFHSIEKELDFLLDLPLDGIGCDFFQNSLDHILPKFPKNKFLIAGVASINSTNLEDLESFTQSALKHLPKERLFLSMNGPAELLPKTVMDAKVQHLIEALS